MTDRALPRPARQDHRGRVRGRARRARRRENASATGATGPFLQPTIALFEHVERHRHLWSSLTRKGGADLITRILGTSSDELVRTHFRVQFPDLDPGDARYVVATAFVAGALIGVLMWWLDSDSAASAAEVHGEFRRLAAQGVRRTLSG